MAQHFFAALAAAAKSSADAGAGRRRRLLAAGSLDLTSVHALSEVAAAAVASVRQQLAAGELYTPDPAVLAVSGGEGIWPGSALAWRA